MSTALSHRIGAFIAHTGLSFAEFNRRVGLSNGMIDRVVKEQSSLSLHKASHIFDAFPDLNPTWLLTGKGDMLIEEAPKAPPQPVALVRVELRPSSKLVRRAVPKQTWKGAANVKLLPGVTASAGTGIISDAVTQATTVVPVPGLAPSTGQGYLALTVEGESMEPTLFSGDLLVIDQVLDLQQLAVNKAYVVLTQDGESYVKRLGSIRDQTLNFVSDNVAYPVLKLHLSRVYQIFRVALRLTHQLDSLSSHLQDDKTNAIIARLEALESR